MKVKGAQLQSVQSGATVSYHSGCKPINALYTLCFERTVTFSATAKTIEEDYGHKMRKK